MSFCAIFRLSTLLYTIQDFSITIASLDSKSLDSLYLPFRTLSSLVQIENLNIFLIIRDGMSLSGRE